ncbi:MAG: type II secretion system F family protein [Actinomycetota bacterium]
MSEIYVLLGLGATFGAVGILSVAVGVPLLDRRRAMRVLESRVEHVPITTNLRERQLSTSITERILLPLASRVQTLAKRTLFFDVGERLRRKLLLAGSPVHWDVEKVAAVKLLGLFAGGGLGVLFVASGRTPATVAMLLLLAAMGYFGPDGLLSHMVDERQTKIRKSLPDTIDLLTISVEAGLAFDAAITQVMRTVPGPLSQELGRMLQEMRLGVSRADSLRHLGDRTNVEELRSFILAMIQADVFGISVGNVLRAQAKELRTKRRQQAEERAMKIPVKILFPLIFCVMPSLFVVVLGPGAIRIFRSFFGT